MISPGRLCPDYWPTVRLAIVWATLNTAIGLGLGVPPIVSVVGFLMGEVRGGFGIGATLSAIFAATIASLAIFGILRCSTRSIAALLRRRHHPDRHWAVARRPLRRTCK